MKIFFYGGTFDPPHKGHESIVNHLLPLCDKLILFPTGVSPFKKNLPLANINHRINMLKILFDNKKIEIDDYERDVNKKNYTYLTVLYLKKKYKNEKLSMIIGEDQLVELHNWKNINSILCNVDIICFNRTVESSKQDFDFKINYIKDFKVDVSSTQIRNILHANKFKNQLSIINPKITNYIKENNLYV